MAHWNQDEAYGGFGGKHVMLKGGYGGVTDALADGLDVKTNVVVAEIRRVDGDGDDGGVTVVTKSGDTFEGSACVVTLPLGCLKHGDVVFDPPLSESKTNAISKLGFGRLNKIALEFSTKFWDDSVDYFGCAAGEVGRVRNARPRVYVLEPRAGHGQARVSGAGRGRSRRNRRDGTGR
jgi:monoamine oxidase